MDIFQACEDEKYFLIQELLEKGENPNVIKNDVRLLDIVSRKGNLDIIKLLISFSADYSYQYYNPIRESAIYGHLDVVLYFLELHSTLDLIEMVLIFSWNNNQLHIFEHFLNNYFYETTLDFAYKNKCYKAIDRIMIDDLSGALCISADYGYFELVKHLIELGVDITPNNFEALSNSAFFGHFDIFKYLFESSKIYYFNDCLPLIFSTLNGHNDISIYLIEKGVNPNNMDALKNIIENNDLELLKFFETNGAKLNNPVYLSFACKKGHINIVEYLIDSGLDINYDNEYALIQACVGNHLEVVKLLVEKGSRLKNDDILSFTCFSNSVEVLKYLIKLGIKVNVKRNIALIDSAIEGHFEILKLLVENGADVNAENDKAIKVASTSGHYIIVEYLLNNGGKITDETVEDCIDIKNYQMVKYLVKMGYNMNRLSFEYLEKYKNLRNKYPVGEQKNFRKDIVCPISHEEFLEEDELLGCNKCFNIYKRDFLEIWLENNKTCPFRCENAEFYQIM